MELLTELDRIMKMALTAWNIILLSFEIAWRDAVWVHNQLVKLGIFAAIIIAVEWYINVYVGEPRYNWWFFYVGGALILALGFTPVAFAIGGATGTVFAALRDEDLSEGANSGIVQTMRITLGILLWFWIISSVLATFPFSYDPTAFFAVAAAIAIVIAIKVHYKYKGRWVPIFVVPYVIVVIVSHLWESQPMMVARAFLGIGSSLPAGMEESRTPFLETGVAYQITFNGDSAVIPIKVGQCPEVPPAGPEFKYYIYPRRSAEAIRYTGGRIDFDRFFVRGKGTITVVMKPYGTCTRGS